MGGLGSLLCAFLVDLQASWVVLVTLGAILGLLAVILEPLGAVLGLLGVVLEPLRAVLGWSWGLLGSSWGLLRWSWGLLGDSWEPLGMVLRGSRLAWWSLGGPDGENYDV